MDTRVTKEERVGAEVVTEAPVETQTDEEDNDETKNTANDANYSDVRNSARINSGEAGEIDDKARKSNKLPATQHCCNSSASQMSAHQCNLNKSKTNSVDLLHFDERQSSWVSGLRRRFNLRLEPRVASSSSSAAAKTTATTTKMPKPSTSSTSTSTNITDSPMSVSKVGRSSGKFEPDSITNQSHLIQFDCDKIEADNCELAPLTRVIEFVERTRGKLSSRLFRLNTQPAETISEWPLKPATEPPKVKQRPQRDDKKMRVTIDCHVTTISATRESDELTHDLKPGAIESKRVAASSGERRADSHMATRSLEAQTSSSGLEDEAQTDTINSRSIDESNEPSGLTIRETTEARSAQVMTTSDTTDNQTNNKLVLTLADKNEFDTNPNNEAKVTNVQCVAASNPKPSVGPIVGPTQIGQMVNIVCHCKWCSASHWPARLKIIGPVTTRPQCRKREQLKVIRSICADPVCQGGSNRLGETQREPSDEDKLALQSVDGGQAASSNENRVESAIDKRSQIKAFKLAENRSLSLTDEISQAASVVAGLPVVLVAGGDKPTTSARGQSDDFDLDDKYPVSSSDSSRAESTSAITVISTRARCKANSISSSVTTRCNQNYRHASIAYNNRCLLCELSSCWSARRSSASTRAPTRFDAVTSPKFELGSDSEATGSNGIQLNAIRQDCPSKSQSQCLEQQKLQLNHQQQQQAPRPTGNKDYLKPGDWGPTLSQPKPKRRHSWICR